MAGLVFQRGPLAAVFPVVLQRQRDLVDLADGALQLLGIGPRQGLRVKRRSGVSQAALPPGLGADHDPYQHNEQGAERGQGDCQARQSFDL